MNPVVLQHLIPCLIAGITSRKLKTFVCKNLLHLYKSPGRFVMFSLSVCTFHTFENAFLQIHCPEVKRTTQKLTQSIYILFYFDCM